ncbi:MAG: hypothetical protein GY765_10320 [bacterium]|nr:hypothetical protein [bacterium]
MEAKIYSIFIGDKEFELNVGEIPFMGGLTITPYVTRSPEKCCACKEDIEDETHMRLDYHADKIGKTYPIHEKCLQIFFAKEQK